MRDHRKLRAFELADELLLAVTSRPTLSFSQQRLDCVSQKLREAAKSVVSSIIRFCSQSSRTESLRSLLNARWNANQVEAYLKTLSQDIINVYSHLGLPRAFATGRPFFQYGTLTPDVMPGLIQCVRQTIDALDELISTLRSKT